MRDIMQEYFQNFNVNEYMPALISGATNVLFAALILIIGFFVAGRINRMICKMGESHEKLDNTLFRFLGSLGKYIVLAFVIIATTFLTYLFNIYALSHVSPSVNGSYIYLQPVLSFIIVSIYAYTMEHKEYAQDINLVKILSCFLVILGVYTISKKPKVKIN